MLYRLSCALRLNEGMGSRMRYSSSSLFKKRTDVTRFAALGAGKGNGGRDTLHGPFLLYTYRATRLNRSVPVPLYAGRYARCAGTGPHRKPKPKAIGKVGSVLRILALFSRFIELRKIQVLNFTMAFSLSFGSNLAQFRLAQQIRQLGEAKSTSGENYLEAGDRVGRPRFLISGRKAFSTARAIGWYCPGD